jgi:translocation and assembly module TamB
VDLTLGGTVGAEAPYEGALRLEARDTSLDPFLRAPFPALPSLVGIVATGSLDIRGSLRAPRDLALDATLPVVQVLLPEYPIRNREPLHVTVAGGRLDLRAVHMAGEGTDLVVEGGADFLGPGPIRVGAKGAADLRTLSVITRNLRGRGAARLAMEVGGTRAAPKLTGTLTLEGAGVRVRGFPHGLDDVHGTVRFTEAAAELSGLTGTLAGGAVELEGQATYAAGQLTSFDIRPSGRDMALRFPEGLRSLIDADLRLFGDASRQWITGTVDVKQAVWTRRYDLAKELMSGGGGFEQPESLGEGLRYDLKVRAPGTLHIDNNLATLQARADLVVQGTFDAPVLLGRAEVDRGRVYFQGRTYAIRRGTIVFSNPQKTDPLFNIEAETRVRSYQVTLKLSGTLEHVSTTLTSDPPLAALQILNLLAGADESAVASLTQAQSAQWQLAATGAASLATGRLSEEVGLERGAERVFGLNRFSIDPSLLRGATTNPTARLTVGKRLTADLSVLYSIDLRGVDGPVLSVEYSFSDRLSILLTQSQLDGLGFDILLRHTQ